MFNEPNLPTIIAQPSLAYLKQAQNTYIATVGENHLTMNPCSVSVIYSHDCVVDWKQQLSNILQGIILNLLLAQEKPKIQITLCTECHHFHTTIKLSQIIVNSGPSVLGALHFLSFCLQEIFPRGFWLLRFSQEKLRWAQKPGSFLFSSGQE